MENTSTRIRERSTGEPAEVLEPARPPFDTVTIIVHWITALLALAMVVTGLVHDRMEGTQYALPLLWAHRSVGVMIWMITVARLCWRLTGARFPEFPTSMTRPQRFAARASEYGLYALLLIQPLSGLAQTVWRGKPFEFLLWSVPAVLPKDLGKVMIFYALHKLGAWCLIGLVCLHAAAALFHHFVQRDDVLEAMAPVLRRKRRLGTVPDRLRLNSTPRPGTHS